jgi:hypothetical protein
MEIFDALLLSLLLAAASAVIPLIRAALVSLFATVVVVSEESQVSSLDRIIAETGWCSARSSSPGRFPAAGTHLFFCAVGGHSRGSFRPIVAVRSVIAGAHDTHVIYRLYAIGSAGASAISGRLIGDPNHIILRYVYAPTMWRRTSVSMRVAPPPAAYKWQKQAVRRLLAAFSRDSRASMLVCGQMGRGKSTLGEFAAVEILRHAGIAAEVIKNVDLTTKGLLLEDAFHKPAVSSPVILMLDEFDTAVDFAERVRDEKQDGRSLADTPTSLLAILDRLNRMPHLIVIATSNKPLAEMTGGKYARYTRRGRIDLHLCSE